MSDNSVGNNGCSGQVHLLADQPVLELYVYTGYLPPQTRGRKKMSVDRGEQARIEASDHRETGPLDRNAGHVGEFEWPGGLDLICDILDMSKLICLNI